VTRRMLIMIALTALTFGGIFGWKTYSGLQMQKNMQAGGRPPVTVSTADVIETSWTPSIPVTGSLRAIQGVNVTPQVAGTITQLLFESGATVKAGDRLAQQYSADDEARLAGLVAETRLAELNLLSGAAHLEDLYARPEHDTERRRHSVGGDRFSELVHEAAVKSRLKNRRCRWFAHVN